MANKQLSSYQWQVLVGVVLSDGWLERSSPTSNVRLGFQFTIKTPLLFEKIYQTFQEYGNVPDQVYKSFRGKGRYLQNRHRTGFREAFNEAWSHFYCKVDGANKRVTPTVSFLKQNLGDVALGYLIACDGSRKGKNNRGFEIHTQGAGFEGTARLALALYENFGIRAYPAFDNHAKKATSYWVIYIPAASFRDWSSRVEGVLKDTGQFDVKMPLPPTSEPRQHTKGTKTHATFLKMFGNNNQLREDVLYKVPQVLIDEYRDKQKKP